MNLSRWYEIKFDNGASLNTTANTEQEARRKAPQYCKGKIVSVKEIGKISVKDDLGYNNL